MGHYYNYYNNKYNPKGEVTQEELQAPPALLTPKDKNNGIPEFWQDNPCYVKSKDFAVQCGKLCARLSQKNNIIITNYASQLTSAKASHQT